MWVLISFVFTPARIRSHVFPLPDYWILQFNIFRVVYWAVRNRFHWNIFLQPPVYVQVLHLLHNIYYHLRYRFFYCLCHFCRVPAKRLYRQYLLLISALIPFKFTRLRYNSRGRRMVNRLTLSRSVR